MRYHGLMGEAHATSDLLSELSVSGAIGDPTVADKIPIILTRYSRGITDTKGARVTTTLAKWGEFRRSEANKTWPIGTIGPKDPAPSRPLKSKCPYEVGAAMRGTRNDENVESIHWIFFDVDDLATYDTMLRRLRELGIAHLLTETASHMLHGLPRWHLYLPLEQPITFPAPGEGHQAIMRTRKAQYMAEYAVIAAWLCRLGEIPKNDSSVNDLSQPCYVARRATEDVPARQVFFSGGRRIRWHQLLLYLGHQPTLLPVPTTQTAASPSLVPATGAALEGVTTGGSSAPVGAGGAAGAAPAGGEGAAAGAAGASTSAAASGKARKGRKGPTPGETTGSLCRIAAEHLGLLGPQVGPGRYHLRCPWAHEHGPACQQRNGVLDSSTMLFLAGAEQSEAELRAQGDGVPLDGGVCCKHEHSQGVHRGVPLNAVIFLSHARVCGAPLPDRPQGGPLGLGYDSDYEEDESDERLETRREKAQARAAAAATALEMVHAKLTLTAFAGPEADGLMDTRTWTWHLFGADGERTGILNSGQPFLDPAQGVLCNRAGLDALRGIQRPTTLALASDAADLAVIAALDWSGENKGRVATFCAPPITLRLLAARIAEWGARVILVGSVAKTTVGRESVVAIADRCEMCEINSPSRALLAAAGSEAAARAALAGIKVWTRAAHGDFTPIPLTKLYGVGDVANGRRFSDSYGHLARYCPETGQWHVWTREAAGGAAWRVDKFRRVEGMAKEVVERIRDIEVARAQQEGLDATELEKHAKRSLARAARTTMLFDAASPDNKTGAGLIEPIDRLDSNPLLVNCMNGTYDIERGTFFAPRQKDLCTKMTAVNYTPDAECPLFMRCLSQWFYDARTGVADLDMIGYLQAMAGYACSGMVREESIWIHVGGGLNGKTTFAKIMQRILGDYAGQVEPETLMNLGDKASPGAMSSLAQLRGLRLAITSESESTDVLSASMLKKLASRGRFRAKMMRQDTFEIEPSHKLWFDTNHMMTVRDRDDGTWRRMHIVRWSNKIPEKDIISNLDERLWAEREGIFQWMLRGAQRWFLHGALSAAHEPHRVKQEVANYRADQDWFAAFFAECCVADRDSSVICPDLKGVFEIWFKDNHGRLPPTMQLWKALTEHGYEAGTNGVHRLRHGFKLVPQSVAYQKWVKAEAAAGVPPVRTNGPPKGW